MSFIVESTWFFFIKGYFFNETQCFVFSFIAGWILARKPSPGPSENTGWRRYIFIFSPFNQLDKCWPTLSLICSNLYFGGYAVVFRKQDDRLRRGVERGSGKVNSVGRGWQYYGLLAATAPKTSLLKWIGVFFSNFVAFIPVCWKFQM